MPVPACSTTLVTSSLTKRVTVSTSSPAPQSASHCFAIAASFRDAARLRFEHEPVSHRAEMVLDGLSDGRYRGSVTCRQWFVLDAIAANVRCLLRRVRWGAGGNAFSTQ